MLYLFSANTLPHTSSLPPLLTLRERLEFLVRATLCGRLGEALKSDAYVDFRAGQPTRVNIVEVSG